MSQVIIVSNRLPVSVKKIDGLLSFEPSLGGIATGLVSFVNNPRNTWIGWPGIASDELTNKDKEIIVAELAKRNCHPVFLTRRQINDFYNGFSNSILWPAFHNLKYNPKSKSRPGWWRAYRQVNQQYAQAVLNLSESGGRIWVHDYQLILVPELLRRERQDITIGFFLHIPLPDVKSLSRLSESKKLLRGMLGANVIGFHTPGYVTNFLANFDANRLGSATANQLQHEGRVIRVADFPMGIDYEKYAGANKSQAVKAATRKYRQRYKRRKVIVAVDRLDPSKGLIERLEAYRLFLEKYPRQRGKVVFSMVAAPSRTDIPAYQKLSKRLLSLAEEINVQFGNAKWLPIDYINISVPFEEVTALLQIADVAFIAPLRDGMNLVAKEFVASTQKNGVLILSETAGASQELQDAILVNPRRPNDMAEALHQALTMRRRELRRRLKRMQHQLSSYTVQDWARDFVGTLQQPLAGTSRITRTLRPKLEKDLFNSYRQSQRRLLLLDYDGSLVPFTENYQDAQPPNNLLQLINGLGNDSHNEVVLISGRGPDDLQKWFGKLPISLVAEHGAAIRSAGHKNWRTLEQPDTNWKPRLLPILEKYAKLTPGARVEVKPHTLVWHYRASPPYSAQKYAIILKRVLKPLLKIYGLELLQGNKILEIKNPQISKGKSAQRWLLSHDYDFILGLGDDMTDEELFAVLPETAYGIKIGHGRTAARFRLSSYKEVNKLLKKLVR